MQLLCVRMCTLVRYLAGGGKKLTIVIAFLDNGGLAGGSCWSRMARAGVQVLKVADTGGGQASQPKTVMSRINLRIDSPYPKNQGYKFQPNHFFDSHTQLLKNNWQYNEPLTTSPVAA